MYFTGMSGEGVWATNPHTLMQEQLQELVNQNGVMGLVDLATTLHHTYKPLLAISQLSPTLHLGVIDKVFCFLNFSSSLLHSFTLLIFYCVLHAVS